MMHRVELPRSARIAPPPAGQPRAARATRWCSCSRRWNLVGLGLLTCGHGRPRSALRLPEPAGRSRPPSPAVLASAAHHQRAARLRRWRIGGPGAGDRGRLLPATAPASRSARLARRVGPRACAVAAGARARGCEHRVARAAVAMVAGGAPCRTAARWAYVQTTRRRRRERAAPAPRQILRIAERWPLRNVVTVESLALALMVALAVVAWSATMPPFRWRRRSPLRRPGSRSTSDVAVRDRRAAPACSIPAPSRSGPRASCAGSTRRRAPAGTGRRRRRLTRRCSRYAADTPAWYPATYRVPGTDIPVARRPGCPHRSTTGASTRGGPTQHAATPAPAPRAVHRRDPRRARRPHRARPRPTLGDRAVHPRPPLPARRGHPLGRRPRRLATACRCSPRSTPRPSTSSSAACTSWPSRPTCSPATTSR